MNSEQADSPPLIEMEAVSLEFVPDVGVFDLSFRLWGGLIFGLIGPSGCGKTTTIRLLNGRYPPDSGKVRVMGVEPIKFKDRDREKIGYLPQQFVLYPNLSVRENIHFLASLYGVSYRKQRRRIREMLEFVELTDAERRLASQLSGGMQRRLMLASVLIHDPVLIFADEPTAGIDPILRERFWDQFRTLRDEGRTLLITTQYIGEAAYCDVVGIMYRGQLIHVDTPPRLRRIAFGGEMILLRVEADQEPEAVRALSRPLIRNLQTIPGAPGLVLIFVDDAGMMLPAIFQMLQRHEKISIISIEEYVPPFDAVFTRLVRQASGVLSEADQLHLDPETLAYVVETTRKADA
jgi:ABC-2 type transport system ATP-binding protein